MIDLTQVSKPTDWSKVRREIEESLTRMLGSVPAERTELQIKVMDESQGPHYVRRRINYFVEEWQRVSGWLFIPEGRDEFPGLVCCHDATPQGKDEAAGISGDPRLAFAQHYAELGYVTLAPDCITAGERVTPGLKPYDASGFYKDNPDASLLGKMLYDHSRALDVLAETKQVDPARMGAVGHGLGGTNALLLAAMDERAQACVASCAFTRFSDDPDPARWANANGLASMPRLQDALDAGELPFDWEHVLALAAPSAVLLLTALNDQMLPKTSSCKEAVKQAKHIYKLLGAAGALENYTHKDGRQVASLTLQVADEWLDRWL